MGKNWEQIFVYQPSKTEQHFIIGIEAYDQKISWDSNVSDILNDFTEV